ncbi:recombinase family protein [Arthrobacter sp. ISL-72]|uniref:recombinase family protein n=1 Tax=Arthrobacter sp. ISL-72 TaxID=2819114 RepID=UPI001BEAB542|nr:recombinase family protein [Arthrobacter sp. ISL-72]MBT2594562.1 recombinase family protein [Arthrobacter sp. ISL-72]
MTTTETPLQILGYVRVSTDKQDIGPEVQIDELRAEAKRMGYELHIVREDAASAATVAKRPLMVQALADMKAGKYHGLMVSKLDRLSRNMEDGTRLLADSQRQGWRIICLDLGVDTASIMGAGMYNMALNFAEIERKFIGKRTKDAMAKLGETKHMGRKRQLPAETVERIKAARASGASMAKIAAALNEDDVPTSQGGAKWYASSVKAVLDSTARESLQGFTA